MYKKPIAQVWRIRTFNKIKIYFLFKKKICVYLFKIEIEIIELNEMICLDEKKT